MGLVVYTVCPVPPALAAAPSDESVLGERFVQVVAHPDDDLLFMSPDLYGGVRGERPSVTVYLTAGEGTAGLDDHHDPYVYAQDRVEGLRAAYAHLAGVRNAWRSTMMTAGRLSVQVDSLVERPRVMLIYAGLPDGGDPRVDGGRDALTRLWAGQSCVRLFGGADRPCVHREDVVRLLRAIYRKYHANVVRTLDPAPPPRCRMCDHPDHVASARFAAAAAEGEQVRLVAYRGYPMTVWAPNVPRRMRELKREIFGIYRSHDYRARSGWHYGAWFERMYKITETRTPGGASGHSTPPGGWVPGVRASRGGGPSAPGRAAAPGPPCPDGRHNGP
ncbi:PIG-L family deacetylase [Nonomuraea guangzhouensis]|uniref:PIG-L family deacetylase n=1 Tax=Nonomuraea guangzhouensis TaxID=1291555 RepID=A0ABW4GAY7_9ACTN|nr:PIG-L family deacetylase [Nonomuraea guangzhouensis]